MEVIMKPTLSKVSKKRKRKTKTTLVTSEPKNVKIDMSDGIISSVPLSPTKSLIKPKKLKKDNEIVDVSIKYPILKNEQLVQRFLNVPMTNNQKGRIRQAIKDSLQGTSNSIVPDIVHNKIQAILKSSENLTDSQLRRIRILYNLLKTALRGEKISDENAPKPVTEKKKKREKNAGDNPKAEKDGVKKEQKEQLVHKVRGPKRYVVFMGNLPLDIDKEKITNHFSEMNEHIKDIRIPKIKDGKKTAIAYVELSNEASYEFALSKHHSMLGNKRINVLYTAQKNGKVTKADAKSKSAKLIAMQKSGKLVGSLPLVKKRSQRRLKMKQARAKEDA